MWRGIPRRCEDLGGKYESVGFVRVFQEVVFPLDVSNRTPHADISGF